MEVVIASVILFSAVASASLALRSAVDAMAKINARAEMAVAVKPVCNRVKTALEEGRTTGSGSFHNTLSFRFEAKKTKEKRNRVPLSPHMAAGEEPAGGFVLTLYSVDLVMTSQNLGVGSSHQFQYQELVWAAQNGQMPGVLP